MQLYIPDNYLLHSHLKQLYSYFTHCPPAFTSRRAARVVCSSLYVTYTLQVAKCHHIFVTDFSLVLKWIPWWEPDTLQEPACYYINLSLLTACQRQVVIKIFCWFVVVRRLCYLCELAHHRPQRVWHNFSVEFSAEKNCINAAGVESSCQRYDKKCDHPYPKLNIYDLKY